MKENFQGGEGEMLKVHFCSIDNRRRTRLGNLGSVLNAGQSLCTTEDIDVSRPEPLRATFMKTPFTRLSFLRVWNTPVLLFCRKGVVSGLALGCIVHRVRRATTAGTETTESNLITDNPGRQTRVQVDVDAPNDNPPSSSHRTVVDLREAVVVKGTVVKDGRVGVHGTPQI